MCLRQWIQSTEKQQNMIKPETIIPRYYCLRIKQSKNIDENIPLKKECYTNNCVLTEDLKQLKSLAPRMLIGSSQTCYSN